MLIGKNWWTINWILYVIDLENCTRTIIRYISSTLVEMKDLFYKFSFREAGKSVEPCKCMPRALAHIDE